MALSVQELGVGVVIGSIIGYLFSNIIPIEYKLWRNSNKESENEADEWYEQAIKDTNNLILCCIRLQKLLNNEDVSKRDILESDEYQDVSEGVDQLVSHMWGAPNQVKNDLRLPTVQEVMNLMTVSGIMAGENVEEDRFRERLERDIDKINSRCLDFLERIEENTDRYTTEQLDDLYGEVQDDSSLSYSEPPIEDF